LFTLIAVRFGFVRAIHPVEKNAVLFFFLFFVELAQVDFPARVEKELTSLRLLADYVSPPPYGPHKVKQTHEVGN
jgi:hypothetical protein